MDDIETRVTTLERDLCNLRDIVLEDRSRTRESLDKIDTRLGGLADIIQKYRIESVGKPTWGVTIIITCLTSLCTGLGIWIITH